MPRHYERSYGRSRALSRLVELVGWLLVVTGAAAALLGFAAAPGLFAAGTEAGLAARLLGLLPGLLLVAAGFGAVQQSHGARARYDSAELSRDLLVQARLSQGNAPPVKMAKPSSGPIVAPPRAVTSVDRPEPVLRAPVPRRTGS
ncbi:hypothetical protein ACFSUD_12780 [Sulfitobacter aestuarii]|uniref:Uncharacterized protein n=1 Tax=Sulfitobacter aestuarii TaxID=2161676 RepID=A0ABW5U3R1_9RHOB